MKPNPAGERVINRRYKLGALLGEGAMGAVYRARDLLRGDRVVALKLLSLERSRPEARETLRSEFYTLTRLRHPNLVRVFDLGVDQDSGRWFLTLEYVAGGTLADWQPGDSPGLLDIAVPLLRGLDYIHRRGFVHADIKPENVLLPADGGEPKIADFGLAGVLGAPGSLRGTLPYTAPEVLKGEPPGPAADLYSLGATLYRAAAGRSPFHADSADRIIEGHLREQPPFPEELVQRLPGGLAVVLRRLLSKPSESRPPSGAAVISAINDLAGTRFPAETEATSAARITRGALIGRIGEVERLQGLLKELTSSGQGGLALVTGPAGVGKSRLIEEIRALGQMEGLTVVVGRSREGSNDPYDAATEAIRDLVPLAPTAPPAALGHLLSPADETRAGGNGADRASVLEAIAGLVRDVATATPLVLIFEDLHQAAPDLLRIITHVVRGVASAPVLVVLSARPDPNALHGGIIAELSAETGALTLPLQPLDAAHTRDMAASLLGGEPDTHLDEFLLQVTSGHPYLIGEAVQGLLDSGALTRDHDGAWRFDAEAASRLRFSPRPGDAALLRIEGLPREVIGVLELLAVAGSTVRLDALQRMSGPLPQRLDETLQWLVDDDILVQSETATSESAYGFTHAFLRDALYHRLDEPTRVRLHGAIAEDLATHAGQHIDAVAAELADHFAAAGKLNDAADFSLRAAAWCRDRFALQSAERHYRRALNIREEQGESDGEWIADVWEQLGDTRRRDGRPLEAAGDYQKALSTTAPGRTPAQEAELLLKRALALIYGGDYEAGRQAAEDARSRNSQSGDQVAMAACENAIGMSYARGNDHRQAETHYGRSLEIRRQLDNQTDTAGSMANLGMVLSFQGRSAEGRRYLEEALDLYRALDDQPGMALVASNLGLLATEAGDLESARAHLEEAEQSYSRLGSLQRRAQCLLNLGRVGLRAGAFDGASEDAAQAADLYARLGMHAEVANANEVLGDIYRESGRGEASMEAHERALAVARRSESEIQEGFALSALAFDYLMEGDADTARQHIDAASHLSVAAEGTRLARRLDRARVLLALVEGDPERAQHGAATLLDDEAETTDRLEALELQLLQARALMALSRFDDALANLEALLHGESGSDIPARRWELLRLSAQCLAGLDRAAEADAIRAQAVEAFAQLASPLSRDFRTALESLPAAVRLRIDAGGSESARLAPDRFLDTMYAVIECLTTFDDADAMLGGLVKLALDLLGAERGLVLLFPEDGSAARVAAAHNIDNETITEATAYSLSVVQEGRLGRAIVSADARTDPRLESFTSVSRLGIRSLLCVPMSSHDRILGAVYLDSRARTIGFDEDDLRFLEALAHHAATALDNSSMMRALKKQNLTLKQELRDRYSFRNIVGRSPAMREVFETLEAVSASSLPVLVRGESGTGKELVARALHYNGPRRDSPFLSENCAAFPEPLLESALFGHVRGAFTGAASEHQGLFQEADQGTLFLDEIGEMSPALQARLTRVLETGEIRPVGGSHSIRVDVRVLAATHRNLEEMTAAETFRRDLLFRFNVITIDLPPLRDRRDDIPLLVSHFLVELAKEVGIPSPGIEDGALNLLQAQEWPGNVRQLRNEISRLLVFSPGAVITTDDVRQADVSSTPLGRSYDEEVTEVMPLKEMERRHILRALKEAQGDRTQAARLLKVGRATVFRKIKDYGLDV